MAVDESSLQISTTISSESKTTEYFFQWQNFSVIQGNEIIFGDVFHANNFFDQLFGDASLQVSYPSDFSIKSVSPAPYERDDSAKRSSGLELKTWLTVNLILFWRTLLNLEIMVGNSMQS